MSGKKNELLKRLIKHLLNIKADPKSPAGIKSRHVLIRAKIRLKLSIGCDYCGEKSKREFSEFHRIFLCKGCRFLSPLKLCTPHHSLTYYGVTVNDAIRLGFSVKDVYDRGNIQFQMWTYIATKIKWRYFYLLFEGKSFNFRKKLLLVTI